jgi:hypothetical protein
VTGRRTDSVRRPPRQSRTLCGRQPSEDQESSKWHQPAPCSARGIRSRALPSLAPAAANSAFRTSWPDTSG